MRPGPLPSLTSEINGTERQRLQVAVSRAIFEANRNSAVPVIGGSDDFKALARRNRLGYAARMDEAALAGGRARRASFTAGRVGGIPPTQGHAIRSRTGNLPSCCMAATECQEFE